MNALSSVYSRFTARHNANIACNFQDIYIHNQQHLIMRVIDLFSYCRWNDSHHAFHRAKEFIQIKTHNIMEMKSVKKFS